MYLVDRYLRLALILGCVTVAGCSSEPVNPSPYMVDAFISAVTARNGAVVATMHEDSPPPAGSGPAAQVSGITTAVNGGSAQVNLAAGNTFNRVYISTPNAQGYWEVLLPSGTTAEDLIVSLARGVRSGSLRVRYQAENAGVAGPYAEQTLQIIGVGTGDVQVSIAWTGATDVDLHVIDPNGEEIYYAHRTSASGGQLDLDSNPACDIDNKNNENIVFPTGTAPTGTYRVMVYYYAACQQPRSDWVVTTLVKGHQPQTFTGSFVGPEGTGNPPVEATTFTY
jgi:hypothetical protein